MCHSSMSMSLSADDAMLPPSVTAPRVANTPAARRSGFVPSEPLTTISAPNCHVDLTVVVEEVLLLLLLLVVVVVVVWMVDAVPARSRRTQLWAADSRSPCPP